MKVAILGYDTEGKVSYEYFKARGDEVVICDQKTDIELPSGAESVLGGEYLNDLDRFDLIVRTAGMPPHVILDKNPEVTDKITAQINEFFRACPTQNVIGVTGTKGKGTTSTLITKMLEASGKEVFIGGNIGIPALSLLNQLSDTSWVVLELSSFQLIDLQHSPRYAACLMIAPEHLNWHADFDEYVQAKKQLFVHQTSEDTAVYFADNPDSERIVSASPGRKIPYFSAPGAYVNDGVITIDNQTICRTDELKLLGKHNWQNACAAVTIVWQIIQDVEAIRSVLRSFSGMEHRLEFVREVNGVKYYDDSFGTTPETAIVAIQAFNEPKVAILGGSDKGASYDDLAQTIANSSIRKVILIGDQASRIKASLEVAGFLDTIDGGDTMEDIIRTAQQHAQSGDIVLLSTACASFDMFKNYKDRGNQFKLAVQSIS